MIIFGALANGVLTVFGSVVGLVLKSRIPEKLGDFLLSGMGLVVILVAIQGMLEGDAVVAVGAMAVGGVIGFLIDIDGWIHRFGDWIQGKLDAAFGREGSHAEAPGVVTEASDPDGQASGRNGQAPVSSNLGLAGFSEGFINASLFICVGAMAIVGSLESGLLLNHSTLITKGLIDMAVCMVFAATYGIGVPFSGIVVFTYEALLSLGASLLAPLLTDAVTTQMICVGSLLLLSIGLNMLKVTNIKVANFLPACFVPMVLCMFA